MRALPRNTMGFESEHTGLEKGLRSTETRERS